MLNDVSLQKLMRETVHHQHSLKRKIRVVISKCKKLKVIHKKQDLIRIVVKSCMYSLKAIFPCRSQPNWNVT